MTIPKTEFSVSSICFKQSNSYLAQGLYESEITDETYLEEQYFNDLQIFSFRPSNIKHKTLMMLDSRRLDFPR